MSYLRIWSPRRTHGGLTLVELLVGLAIVGALDALLLFSRPAPVSGHRNSPLGRLDSVATSHPKLELRVVSARSPMHLDRNRVVQAIITNRGDSPATLVMPGDGSLEAWRTPVVAWSVLPADDPTAVHTPPPSKPQFRCCGDLDPLTQDQLFTLRPGQSRVIARPPNFPGPGRYRIVYFYRNDPNLRWVGIYASHPSTMQRLKHSTPCSLVSNELTVTVRIDRKRRPQFPRLLAPRAFDGLEEVVQ